MKNTLTIHLSNPIDFHVIDDIEKTLSGNPNAQFLIIDTGNHDFASITVMKYFREQMLAFAPLLKRFKKIAIIHPEQYSNISDSPETYDYFTSQETAFQWFSPCAKNESRQEESK